MERKTRILFFITSLAGGGAERVVLSLLQHFDRSVFDPALCLLRREGELLSEVPADVMVHSLEMKGPSIGKQFIPMVRALKRFLEKERPDVVISFLWEPNLINACARSFFHVCPAVLSERNAIGIRLRALFSNGLKAGIALRLTKLFYRKGDHIVSVSKGVKDELVSLGVNEKNITVIHNPLNRERIERMADEPFSHERPFLLYVGRLTAQKNVQLLLNAFANIQLSGALDLIILGQGEKSRSLQKLAHEIGIAQHVFFKGFDPNPYRYMKKAHAVVLPSNFEGFPNVLLEAMFLGTPVISTDCPHGPSEIINQGENGVLVPMNARDALTAALEQVLDDKAFRDKLIAEGRKTASLFSIEKVVKQYEVLIQYMHETGQKKVARA